MASATVFGALAGGAPAAVAGGWSGELSPDPGTFSNQLWGVAATSSTNAWAVGNLSNATGFYRTLVAHWNGTAWTAQTSANRGGSSNTNALFGVAAVSASDAWAVGYYFNGTTDRTLIEHLNGTAWTAQTSPNPGGSTDKTFLHGVAATSSTNAWAVGYYYNQTPRDGQPVIERWNGTAWKAQKSPTLHGVLLDVAAVSANNAWAVGYYYNGTTDKTLVEHWNGTAWKVQTSPTPGSSSSIGELQGVAATSRTNAWAVGYYADPMNDLTLIEHWNGKAWKVMPSPSPGTGPSLSSVVATSSTNAWAVGTTNTRGQSLIEQWNGTAWTVQTSPAGGELDGVAATSASDAWAVGFDQTAGITRIEHCC